MKENGVKNFVSLIVLWKFSLESTSIAIVFEYVFCTSYSVVLPCCVSFVLIYGFTNVYDCLTSLFSYFDSG